MAVFRAFKAFRPSKEHQADIPALPYDVMSSAEAREYVKGKPLSFMHTDRAEVDFPLEQTSTLSKFIKKQRKILKNSKKAVHLFRIQSRAFIFTAK